MPKEFTPLRFGNNVKQTKEYREMRDYIRFDATVEDLQEIFKNTPPVEMAWGGKNMGHQTIQAHYWIWRKGTRLVTIDMYLYRLIEERKKNAKV